MPMPDRPLPPYMVHDRQRLLRGNALKTMLLFGPLAAAGAALAAFGAAWLKDGPFDFVIGPWLPYVAALPALPFLAALLVYVTGRPFGELASAWDELQGWQRGILGIVIVLVAAAVILGGVVLALTRLTSGG